MPFTVSPGTYQGGQYLMTGLSSLGQGAGDILKDYTDTQSKLAGADLIVQHAFAAGQQDPSAPGAITMDDFNKYQKMNSKEKLAFAGAQASLFANNLQQQMQAAQIQHLKAQAALATSEAQPYTPRLVPLDVPGTGGDQATYPSQTSPLLQGTPLAGADNTPAAGASQVPPFLAGPGAAGAPTSPLQVAQAGQAGTVTAPPQRVYALQTGRQTAQMLPGQEGTYAPGYGNIQIVHDNQGNATLGVYVNGQFHPVSQNPLAPLYQSMLGPSNPSTTVNQGVQATGAGTQPVAPAAGPPSVNVTGGISPEDRAKAIKILNDNKQPVTDDNIKYVLAHLPRGN